MNMLDALADPALFGSLPAFADLSTWRPWLAFLRAFYGLPMDDEDLELFQRHTGREAPREGGYPEAAVVVGRQSGKTRVAALGGHLRSGPGCHGRASAGCTFRSSRRISGRRSGLFSGTSASW